MPIDNRYPCAHPAPRPPHRIPGPVRAVLYLLGGAAVIWVAFYAWLIFELSRPGVHFG